MSNTMQAVVEDHCLKYNFKGPYLLLKDLTELIVQNKKELKIKRINTLMILDNIGRTGKHTVLTCSKLSLD